TCGRRACRAPARWGAPRAARPLRWGAPRAVRPLCWGAPRAAMYASGGRFSEFRTWEAHDAAGTARARRGGEGREAGMPRRAWRGTPGSGLGLRGLLLAPHAVQQRLGVAAGLRGALDDQATCGGVRDAGCVPVREGQR